MTKKLLICGSFGLHLNLFSLLTLLTATGLNLNWLLSLQVFEWHKPLSDHIDDLEPIFPLLSQLRPLLISVIQFRANVVEMLFNILIGIPESPLAIQDHDLFNKLLLITWEQYVHI